MTPPDTKIYFVLVLLDILFFDRGTINNSKSQKPRQWGKFITGAPDEILHRLPEFIRLFLSDGLLPDLVYALELKTV